ncbi:MAG: PEP-CTERM sorting domain-containing protein [Candidatus Omnitrophota bacterium]
MKISYVGLLLLLLFIFPCVASANLLTNGDFETWVSINGAEPVPDWWVNVFNFSSPLGSREETIIHSGSRSGKIAVADVNNTEWGGWFQNVYHIGPGETFYIYQPYSIPSDLFSTLTTLQVRFMDNVGGVLTTHKVQRSLASNGWEFFSTSILSPERTHYAEYGIMMEKGGSSPFSGAVYFDDSYFDRVPIPEPSSIFLLGVGLAGIYAGAKRKQRRQSHAADNG